MELGHLYSLEIGRDRGVKYFGYWLTGVGAREKHTMDTTNHKDNPTTGLQKNRAKVDRNLILHAIDRKLLKYPKIWPLMAFILAILS